MSFRNNMLNARSNIAFVVGLSLAAAIALSVESRVNTNTLLNRGRVMIETSADQLPLAPPERLRQQDIEAAEVAWAYFETNFQPTTGLVNSAHQYPSTTIWDQSSYLLGLISARKIGIIDERDFDFRLGLILSTLSRLQLFEGRLPNKVYDTRSLEMTDYNNQLAPGGIGWSAIDVARIVVPLNIILFDFPKHSAAAAKILQNWDFDAMLSQGTLFGARVHSETGASEQVQEGRLGYEEYAARAVGLLGLDALSAGKYDDYLKFESIYGLDIAVDSRSYSDFDAHNYLVSEPYILTAIEFGFDREGAELASRVFQAQERRFQDTEILTAVSEDNVDQPPYFVYNTVFANGKPWNAIADDGTEYDDLRTVSTKAVFGWDAIYGTAYSQQLMDHVAQTATDDRGWLSGLYESDARLNDVATANTNGIILETIHYRRFGPLLAGRFSNKLRGERE